MKGVVSFPFAIVAALMFPRVKQEVLPPGETESLERALKKRQSSKKELEKLLERVRSGEKVSLETLFPASENPAGQATLTVLRQEVVTLQEEYENLSRTLLVIPEETQSANQADKKPEEPKPHPLIAPDRTRLGRALFRSGKFEDALAVLQKEETPWSSFLAASCQEKLGRTDEAVAAFEKVVEKFPQSAAGKQAKAISEYLRRRAKLGRTAELDAILAQMAAEVLENAPEEPAKNSKGQ